MSFAHFYKKLEQVAFDAFPVLKAQPPVQWDHLISPLELKLPKAIQLNAHKAIEVFHRISRQKTYQENLNRIPEISEAAVQNESVLMAFDFHTNAFGECRLIEVNTNASGFLFSALMEATHKQTPLLQLESMKSLKNSFLEDWSLWKHGGRESEPLSIAIVDDEPDQQKMFPEFLMYQAWMEQSGWKAEICDVKALQFNNGQLSTPTGNRVNFVYNRSTDFYLSDPVRAALRNAFLSGSACVSPQPKEYWLLADKNRLIDLTRPAFLQTLQLTVEDQEALKQFLIPTFEKSDFPSAEQIWSERKALFFKPKNSHGGKSVYRGESVSRKVFERLMSEDILIQRYVPAQKVPIEDPRSVLNNWKFDLRFFVYRNTVQATAARIYQGQVTNFSSPLGGFTSVQFV